jgi:phospholipid-translocating ATPase
VPETIEKLQKANIKIWMLTGDKRETAINIAHAARICKTYSTVVVLDEEHCETQISATLLEIAEAKIAHTVVVVDGKLLGAIESRDELATMFAELLIKVDSVIVCRASPSQKAAMIKEIRRQIPGSMTLAIGDGGNDIAMIQEAHVGVGISGKEGLQAARVADYSIAQFRFLQRLLLVHGHWNYIRTANYVVWTFWKEMMFYCVQIMYQRWNGYTGPSFYETNSLTVWNTLFSSLCVMLPGIFEQDLSAATLLAVPEIYTWGQMRKSFNMRLYTWWMIIGAVQAQVIWWMVYGLYGVVTIVDDDQGLFAMGNLAFSVCVVFLNLKLLYVFLLPISLQPSQKLTYDRVYHFHHKTWVPIFGAVLTIAGWWAWNLFLSAISSNTPGPYTVKDGFIHHFGANITWWAVFVAIMAALIIPDLVFDALKRRFWPNMIEIWQELEQDPEIMRKLREEDGDETVI